MRQPKKEGEMNESAKARLRELAATATAAMDDIYWLLSAKAPEYSGIYEGAVAARRLHVRLCEGTED